MRKEKYANVFDALRAFDCRGYSQEVTRKDFVEFAGIDLDEFNNIMSNPKFTETRDAIDFKISHINFILACLGLLPEEAAEDYFQRTKNRTI